MSDEHTPAREIYGYFSSLEQNEMQDIFVTQEEAEGHITAIIAKHFQAPTLQAEVERLREALEEIRDVQWQAIPMNGRTYDAVNSMYDIARAALTEVEK